MLADPNDPGDLSSGAELPGGYTVEHVVVQGRTRLIYAARSGDGGIVAVHVLDAGLVDGLGEWFSQGATARAAIVHPSLPRTLAVGQLDDGRPFEVTELLEGTSMREALEATPKGLDPLAVVHVVNEVSAALDALHARTPSVVHRTLCPEHLMVLRDTHEVRLLGLFYGDRPQFEGVRPGYRSPEELAGVLSLGPRADVFSLATVAYELLTGRAAWPHVPELALDSMRVGVRDRISVLLPVLPAALDAVFERAWSLSPDARHSTAGHFAKALRAAIDPLDMAGALASNVFDDRPTSQVPVMSQSLRNNTLLNAGAVAQAIVPRGLVGKVLASDAKSATEPVHGLSRPPMARPPRAPLPPATSPVRVQESEPPPRDTEPLPEEMHAAVAAEAPTPSEVNPPVQAPPSPEVIGPTDLVALIPDRSDEKTPLAVVTPTVPLVVAPPPEKASSPLPEPPDEPTPLLPMVAPSSRAAETEAASVAEVEPAVLRAVTVLPMVVNSPPPLVEVPPPPSPAYGPPEDPPTFERHPSARESLLFVDEPTAVIHTLAAAATPWTRSPIALGGLFMAHALLIVGIAHAIAYALAARPSPAPQFIQGPSPVCAPCAACPAPVANLPEPISRTPAPVPTVIRVVRPVPVRPAERTQIIRSLPDFGRSR